MTSSTAFSAGSASASEIPRAEPSGGLFFGVDEAGYGPNLGPLLITVTQWSTPGPPGECAFYKLLQRAVRREGARDGKRLHVADSKVVLAGGSGWVSLETTALALLRCLGIEGASFQNVRGQLCGAAREADCLSGPWYAADLELPRAARTDDVARLADGMRDCMRSSGAQLLAIRSDLVVEDRFNRLLGLYNSKGLALSRLTFQLLRSVWSPETPGAALVVCDKHGGRNRYDELLAETLDGEMIFRLEERRELSRYRVGQTELRFQVAGERHLPVAASSIICKYLRELAMDLFNAYWRGRCPDIRPTRGYPGDARRFREEIDASWRALGMEESVLWRSR